MQIYEFMQKQSLPYEAKVAHAEIKARQSADWAAANEMVRIAKGTQKFVITNPKPFILNYKFENEPEIIAKPLSTITAINGHYVVAPFLTQYHSYDDSARCGNAVPPPFAEHLVRANLPEMCVNQQQVDMFRDYQSYGKMLERV